MSITSFNFDKKKIAKMPIFECSYSKMGILTNVRYYPALATNETKRVRLELIDLCRNP